MGIPTTVVIDVQNAHGIGGDILGTRRKPDPEGVLAALAPYGFDVVEIDIPVGTPDQNDLRHVVPKLSKHADGAAAIASDLSLLTSPVASGWLHTAQRELGDAERFLRDACVGPDHMARLVAVNTAAEEGRYLLVRARRHVADVRERLVSDAAARRTVPGTVVADVYALCEIERRLGLLCSAVDAIGSYAWASRQNMDFEAQIRAFPGPPVISVRPGRFRPGFEDKGPDEKQIDSLCVIACLEHVRRAVEAGEPHAVVLFSDDDDLSPALRASAALAHGTAVRVVVAGSVQVQNRWRSLGSAPDRPRWVVLDQHAWHRALGLDPLATGLQRYQLARLALGHSLPFNPGTGDGLGTTAQGLDVRVRGFSGELPAVLQLTELDWRAGRSSVSLVPTAIVGLGAPNICGFVATCLPGGGSRLALDRIPVELANGRRVDVKVPAPGWFRTGDQVVIADATGSGSWRVLGWNGRPPPDLATATRGRARKLTITSGSGAWTVVRTEDGPVSVLAPAGVDLAPNDEVVVVIYDRSGGRHAPRGLLLSSAL